MLIYQYSGTLTGFLCVIFAVYTKKEPPLFITSSKNLQYSLQTEIAQIEDDDARAARIENALGENMEQIVTAFCSGQHDKEMVLFQYIRLLFRFGPRAHMMQADTHVIAFRDLYKRVTREIDRLKGFLRFKELANGILYAQIEPDHDITGILLPYFCSRNALTPFIIHDTRRDVLGMYNTKSAQLIRSPAPIPQIFTQAEAAYQQLWRQYFHTVSIPDRANKRQQLNCMPRRYRKNMSETY